MLSPWREPWLLSSYSVSVKNLLYVKIFVKIFLQTDIVHVCCIVLPYSSNMSLKHLPRCGVGGERVPGTPCLCMRVIIAKSTWQKQGRVLI